MNTIVATRMPSTTSVASNPPSAVRSKFHCLSFANQAATFCELDLHFQLGVLCSQSVQLSAFGILQWCARRVAGFPGLPHPFPQRDLVHTNVARNLGNRTAVVDDERYRVSLVLLGISLACRTPFLCLPKDRATLTPCPPNGERSSWTLRDCVDAGNSGRDPGVSAAPRHAGRHSEQAVSAASEPTGAERLPRGGGESTI